MSNIWVLGSAAWDDVFEVDHLPVAGGRAVATSLGRRAGGSTGNIARALSSAGHRVALVMQVGEDALGAALLDEVTSWGIETEHVRRHGDCTPESLIFLDANGERTIVVLHKECASTVPVPYAAISDADCVYVGCYGDFEPELVPFLRRSSALVGTAVPTPQSAGAWFAHIVIGSATEFPREWLDDPYGSVCRHTGAGTELQWVVVTHGPLGATAYGRHRATHIPPVSAADGDSTGAGDSFAAGLLHGLLQGHDVGTAGRLGARWGAAALALPQSVPPRWAQLDLGDPAGDWHRRLSDA